MRRVAVIASASGCGKTTLGRRLSEQLQVPFVELDELNHVGPDWIEATSEELRAKVTPIVVSESWVIDGSYRGKLGDLVLAHADLVVWLDLPRLVWLPRLLRRTFGRVVRREELWGGNRETLRNVLFSRESLVLFALRTYRARRRLYPARLARFHVVRLRSRAEVDDFLSAVDSRATSALRPTPQPSAPARLASGPRRRRGRRAGAAPTKPRSAVVGPSPSRGCPLDRLGADGTGRAEAARPERHTGS